MTVSVSCSDIHVEWRRCHMESALTHYLYRDFISASVSMFKAAAIEHPFRLSLKKTLASSMPIMQPVKNDLFDLLVLWQ